MNAPTDTLNAPAGAVVITGGRGCVGARLVERLSLRGVATRCLVRGVDWEIPVDASDAGRADPALFSAAHAVVHLAGEPIAVGRWTKAKMERIRASRVEGTRLIARSCARAEVRPRVLVVASGVGYYGNRGDEELTEQAGVGSGFLAEVARDWEAAAAPAVGAGIRVVWVRMGVVLAREGGMLAQCWRPARAGLLMRVAGPQRWVSWIGMHDLLGVLELVMERETVVGAVNAVVPTPTMLNELIGAVAAAADRPVLGAVPEWVVRGVMGKKAEAVLEGCRAVPEKLRRLGFKFAHGRPGEAIGAEMKLGV